MAQTHASHGYVVFWMDINGRKLDGYDVYICGITDKPKK